MNIKISNEYDLIISYGYLKTQYYKVFYSCNQRCIGRDPGQNRFPVALIVVRIKFTEWNKLVTA
jgi:hypothetical protein